jgi:MoaA/NifB/PqqE/SkfB family radical SAM enzyme
MKYLPQLKFGINLVRHKLFKHRFPAHVTIVVNNKCNLDCSYCWAKYSFDKGPDPITLEKMKSLIDELHSMGTYYVGLTGGETLLRKDLKEIIDYVVVEKGMKCSLGTNGLLLEARLDEIKNVCSINVSLDGNEEQHIQNRGAQNYDKLMRGIELAVKTKIPVAACTVINRSNMDCVDHIVHLAKEMGFTSNFHIPYGRLNVEEMKDYDPMTNEEIRVVMQKIIDYKNAGYPVNYSHKTLSYVRDWPFEQSSRLVRHDDSAALVKHSNDSVGKKFKMTSCIAGDAFAIVDPKGKVFPCAVLTDQVEAKNFMETGFKDAWDFVPSQRCETCSFFHQEELNLLLSLDPGAWLSVAKTKLVNILRDYARISPSTPSR